MFFSIYSCSIIPCNCSPPSLPGPGEVQGRRAGQIHRGVQLQPQAAGEDPEQAGAQVQARLQPGEQT